MLHSHQDESLALLECRSTEKIHERKQRHYYHPLSLHTYRLLALDRLVTQAFLTKARLNKKYNSAI